MIQEISKVRVVILAAGQGKRMYSTKPKVLHNLAGETLLGHVLSTVNSLGCTLPPIVITGYQAELVHQEFYSRNIIWVTQEHQLGTGHAAQQALPIISEHERVLILYGDVPLITSATLSNLLNHTATTAVGLIAAHLPNPSGYGRIIRDHAGCVIKIVEERDADDSVCLHKEVNSGIYCVSGAYLHRWLPRLNCHNAQGEYYLTDIIASALAENITISTIEPQQYIEEIFGVNDRVQLHYLERFMQYQQAQNLMLKGVSLQDASRLDIKGEVTVGHDVYIDANVNLSGRVLIGNECFIGPNVSLCNVKLGNKVTIKANSVIEGAELADNVVVGPFARIRPGTRLAEGSKVGNFVEIKNSKVGMHSKINHLSYIGDSDLGSEINIGAGTITCNYDGCNKHRTVIGDRAFVGSGTELVAPINIGCDATIGAGSTITKDVPAQQLTVARAKQKTILNWRRRPVLIKDR